MNAEEMFDGEVIRATYIAEFDKESGITTWIYIPEEKKEKDMKETNLEHYKKELEKIFYKGCNNAAAMFCEVKANCDSNIRSQYGRTYIDDILDWMAQPYKEQILDETEREYLSAVIRPFRKEVNTISKFHTRDKCRQYIYIELKYMHCCTLPDFPKGIMYKGMEDGRHYTLDELGL